MMRGDEAVVEDVCDVGLGGEAAHGGGVVFGAEGLGGGDAEVWVALGQAGSGGEGAGFGVGGDGGVAVDDEIVVGKDGAGLGRRRGALGVKGRGESEEQDRGRVSEEPGEDGMVLKPGRISTGGRGWSENGHDGDLAVCAEVCIG